MTFVFVYGTLKRGLSNHHILAGQHYLGDASTVPGYRLFAIADFPGMVAVEDAPDDAVVHGEVWRVDDTCLVELDRLEGVDEGLYERVPIPLQAPFDQLAVQGYLFLHPVAHRRRVGAFWNET